MQANDKAQEQPRRSDGRSEPATRIAHEADTVSAVPYGMHANAVISSCTPELHVQSASLDSCSRPPICCRRKTRRSSNIADLLQNAVLPEMTEDSSLASSL